MKKIEFDTVNGVLEVNDFDETADFCGTFSDDFSGDFSFIRGWFGEDFEGTRSMEVGDKLFAFIDEQYGITKI
jgi:hypothetical protein